MFSARYSTAGPDLKMYLFCFRRGLFLPPHCQRADRADREVSDIDKKNTSVQARGSNDRRTSKEQCKAMPPLTRDRRSQGQCVPQPIISEQFAIARGSPRGSEVGK